MSELDDMRQAWVDCRVDPRAGELVTASRYIAALEANRDEAIAQIHGAHEQMGVGYADGPCMCEWCARYRDHPDHPRGE